MKSHNFYIFKKNKNNLLKNKINKVKMKIKLSLKILFKIVFYSIFKMTMLTTVLSKKYGIETKENTN